jgi:hypothetical protein
MSIVACVFLPPTDVQTTPRGSSLRVSVYTVFTDLLRHVHRADADTCLSDTSAGRPSAKSFPPPSFSPLTRDQWDLQHVDNYQDQPRPSYAAP